jgi:hypothetical protein
VDADLDNLATALYVRVDDLLKSEPHRAPWRPKVGIAPKLTDAELVTLSVMQALLGYPNETRWLRFAGTGLRHLFPYLPQQSGYNKQLRKLSATIGWLIGMLPGSRQSSSLTCRERGVRCPWPAAGRRSRTARGYGIPRSGR